MSKATIARTEAEALDCLDEINDHVRVLEQRLAAMKDEGSPFFDELMDHFRPAKFNLELMFETLDER